MDLFISSNHVDITSKRRSPSWVVTACLFSVFLFLSACSGEEEASQKNLANEAASDSGDSDKKAIEETATSSNLASSSVTTADDSGTVKPVDEKETTASAKEVTTTTNKPATTNKKTISTASASTQTTQRPSYTCPTDWCVQGGTLEAIFTDCVSHKILGEDGKIEDGQVSCDGGSFIVVDGVQIRTASGFVISAADRFSKHPVDLRLGSKVNVQAQKTSYNAKVFTLNCEECDVVKSWAGRSDKYTRGG